MLAANGRTADSEVAKRLFGCRARLRVVSVPAKLSPCPDRPNCVCSRSDALRRNHVTPIRVSGDPGAFFGRFKRVLARQSRTEIVSETDDYVHAACRTLLGFVDDLEARLSLPEGVIHVRSASRVGYYDFGVNRARVETLRRALRGAR